MNKKQFLKLIDDTSGDIFHYKMQLEKEAIEEFDRTENLNYLNDDEEKDHSRTDKLSREFIECASRWHKIRDLHRIIKRYDQDDVELQTIINDMD